MSLGETISGVQTLPQRPARPSSQRGPHPPPASGILRTGRGSKASGPPPAPLAAPYEASPAGPPPPPPSPRHLPARPIPWPPPQSPDAFARPNSPPESRGPREKRRNPKPTPKKTLLNFPAAQATAAYWSAVVTWSRLSVCRDWFVCGGTAPSSTTRESRAGRVLAGTLPVLLVRRRQVGPAFLRLPV